MARRLPRLEPALASPGAGVRGAQWVVQLRERLACAPADPVAWMERHTRLLKSDTYSRVGMLEVGQQACFLKLYIAKSPLQALGFALGYGRGTRSFDAARRMALAGLRVPEPRACLLVSGGMMLLTEGFENGRDLRTLWLARPGDQDIPRYMEQAGQSLAALHRSGFAHGDCKWSNLLWCDGTFYFVDLEAVRETRAARASRVSPQARQLRDLARFTIDAEALGASPAGYGTFLESYCAGGNFPRDGLTTALQPFVGVMRKRHERKYGRSFSPLL